MNDTDSPLETRQRFPLVAISLGFAVLDFLAIPMAELSDLGFLTSLLTGLMGGQLGLLAIWAVLGPQHWIVRLAVTFELMLLLSLFLALGVIVTEGPEYAAREAEIVLFAPILFLAVQSPLWILRMTLGCRIVHAATETDPSSELSRQFGLSHLLGATAVIAIALGLASLGKQERYAWAAVLLTCAILATWSALSTLPCVWAALVARDKRIGTLGIVANVLVLTLLVLFVPGALGGRAPSLDMGLTAFLVCATPIGLMLAVLCVARKRGFRLVRWKSQERGSGDDSPSETDPGGPRASSRE